MALAQAHEDAKAASTPGAVAAEFVKAFASHVQAACNGGDVGEIRALAVEAAAMADDVGASVDAVAKPAAASSSARK